MTASPRTLLLTSLICLATSLLAARAASQPAPLPSEPQRLVRAIPPASTVTEQLNIGAWTARSCRIDAGELSCSCLRGGTSTFQKWSEGDIEGLVHRSSPVELMTAGSALWLDGFWILRDVDMLLSGTVLHVDEMRLQHDQAELAGLTWFEPGGETVSDCTTTIARGRRRASAQRASYVDGRWELRGYRVGPWPVAFGRSAHRTAVGLLPPVVRTADGAAWEGEAAAHLLHGVFVLAGAGIDAPISFGLGYASSRRGQPRVLRGMVAAQDGDLAPVVIGDVAIGESTTHLRGHVEHPATDSAWRLRRAEADGFFRSWRATRLGLAASGDAHALQLSGSVLTAPDVPDPVWAGLLTYGISFDSGRLLSWTVDLEHHSEVDVSTRHSTTVGIAGRVPLGWSNRAWLTPGLDLLANYGAVTVNRGFDASTTLSALGQVEAGLAVEGRFATVRHRIASVVRVGGELGGTQQRQPREGAPPYPFTQPDRWRWTSAVLEQSLRHGEFALDLPVGAFADALGDEQLGDASPSPFARVSATLPGARVDFAGVCIDACDRVGAFLGAQVAPRRGLRLSYSVADLADRGAAVVFADRLTDRAFTAVRLINDDSSPIGFSHFAALLMERGAGYARLDGRYGVDGAARGIGAGAGWDWPALGWGLGASGSWAPITGDWAASAGLRFTGRDD